MNLTMPMANKELARSARDKRTYALRLVVVGLPAVAIFFMWFADAISGSIGTPDSVGSFLARMVTVFQFAVVLLFIPLSTAGLIAQEKQDRTLGLLLLADLRGTDIYLAKFVSAFIQAELLILSGLPILAFAALLGGVSIPAMTLRVLLFSVWASAVCALGLLWSTCSRRPTTALFLTVLTLVLWIGTPVMTGILWMFRRIAPVSALESVNIMAVIWRADDPAMTALYCMPTIVFCLAVTVVVSWAAILLVPRQAYDKPRTVRRPRREGPRRRFRLARVGPVGQIVERTAAGFSSAIRSGPLRVIVALGLAPISLLPCFGLLFILILVVYDVISSIARLRQSRLLDDLRLTVGNFVDAHRFARDVFRAQLNRALFYFPAITVSAAFSVIGPAMTMGISWSFDDYYLMFLGVFVVLVWLAASAVAQLYFLVAISCYCTASRFRPVVQSLLAALLYVGVQAFVGIAMLAAASVFGGPTPYSLQFNSALVSFFLGLFGIALYAVIGYGCYRRFRSNFARALYTGQ